MRAKNSAQRRGLCAPHFCVISTKCPTILCVDATHVHLSSSTMIRYDRVADPDCFLYTFSIKPILQVSNGTAEGTGTDAERRASQAWCGRVGGAACSGSLRTLQDVTSCMPQDAGRHKAGVQFWGDFYAYDMLTTSVRHIST